MKRDELKQEIKQILDFCDCYRYTDEGLDLWLAAWWEGCGKQITEIAEKSPYYNGNYQIVFPAQYPREINRAAINNFSEWIDSIKAYNIEPFKWHGFTIRELCDMKDRLERILRYMRENNFDTCNGQPYDWIKEDYDRYREYIDELITERPPYQCVDNEYYSEYDAERIYMCNNLTFLLGYVKEQFLNDDLAKYINNTFPKVKASAGQKSSRIIRQIAAKYGITDHPDWEREFAKFADAVNPLNVTKWTVISWHPVDFLTFCWGNSWSTCSNIDKRNKRGVKIGSSKSSVTNYVDDDYVFRGEHAAGALSYMFDNTSFIYYTVNHKYDGNQYELQPKESRCVFSFNDNTLLQSRMYPQCMDDGSDTSYRIPREIVQKVIADALEVPNLWTVRTGKKACCEFGKSIGVHYPDYTDVRNKMCNISYLGDEPHEITIGHDAICPECGCYHKNYESLNCEDCNPER